MPTIIYPPIVETFMPAFVRTSSCKIYFSLPRTTSIDDIKNAQVIILNQNTGRNELDTTVYPSQIKIATIKIDSLIANDYKYYITVDAADLADESFKLNTIYRAQIRLTSTEASPLPADNKIATWLYDNQKYFSEWSTTCLLKGIEQPHISINGFTDLGDDNTSVSFSSELAHISGKMYFKENASREQEYLSSYRIKIISLSTGLTVENSGTVYTNEYNKNEINYTVKAQLSDTIKYKLFFSFETNNGYTEEIEFDFTIYQGDSTNLNAAVTCTIDENNGTVKVRATSQTVYSKRFIIKRTSNESNFSAWEDVYTFRMGTLVFPFEWKDYTTESGITYKYAIQPITDDNQRGIVNYAAKTITPLFEDIFLLSGGNQLKVKFNPTVDSFRLNTIQSKTETLGSKYPFISKNGQSNYKTFSLGGLISHIENEDNDFLPADYINADNYVKERIFRENVLHFLNDGNVKLFKSLTEGNLMVKLMDITLSPIAALGRMMYSFSATVVEVDEVTVANCDKYKIQSKVNNGNAETREVSYQSGQLMLSSAELNEETDLIKLIKKGDDAEFIGLEWFEISFKDDEYPIQCLDNNQLIETYSINENVFPGHILRINGEDVFVSDLGYEMNSTDSLITDLKLYKNESFVLNYRYAADPSKSAKVEKVSASYSGVGQEIFSAQPEEDIIPLLLNKHSKETETFYEELVSITGVTIECERDIEVMVKYFFEPDYVPYQVTASAPLNLYEEDKSIESIYVQGLKLQPSENPKYVQFNEYAIGESFGSCKNQHVYIVDGEEKILIDGQFVPFENEIALTPVEILIDYYYEAIKGGY